MRTGKNIFVNLGHTAIYHTGRSKRNPSFKTSYASGRRLSWKFLASGFYLLVFFVNVLFDNEYMGTTVNNTAVLLVCSHVHVCYRGKTPRGGPRPCPCKDLPRKPPARRSFLKKGCCTKSNLSDFLWHKLTANILKHQCHKFWLGDAQPVSWHFIVVDQQLKASANREKRINREIMWNPNLFCHCDTASFDVPRVAVSKQNQRIAIPSRPHISGQVKAPWSAGGALIPGWHLHQELMGGCIPDLCWLVAV